MTDTNKAEHELAIDLARNSLHLPRSTEWLENNGIRLDNTVPRESTMPQAGQGAFAKRFLANGTIVVPVPLLLVIPDKESLDIYTLGEGNVKIGDPIGKQLVTNYCFGHAKSSLLLCPSSNANLINHCSHRMIPIGQCNENGPNARIKWSSGWDKHTSDWLTKSLDDIKTEIFNGKRGLSFEVIATRDIKHGEEVSNIYQHHCITLLFGKHVVFVGS